MTAAVTERPDTETTTPVHTGGMIALVPADPGLLAVEGGDPPEQLHLTLAYLGDDVTGWDPEMVAAVHQVARELTDPAADTDGTRPVPADGENYRGPGQRGPLTLTVFSWSQFNPNGGPDGQEPCLVYQFSGDGDLGAVEHLASDVQMQVRAAIGEVLFPEQHARFEPHVTAGYNLPADALTFTGPVVFDRLRVALADQVTDYPLGGDADAVVASGMPDAPQSCLYGSPEHPAARSLLFDGDRRYVPVCDDHEDHGRASIETVTGYSGRVIDIKLADRGGVFFSSRTADHA